MKESHRLSASVVRSVPVAVSQASGLALPRSGRSLSWGLLALSLSGALGLALSPGCKRGETSQVQSKERPTLRLYAVSSLAAALEPCGCVADMLGGIDRAGAWMKQQQAFAPQSVFVASGPLFFENPEDKAGLEIQNRLKAEALADALAQLKLDAFTPGQNDLNRGPALLQSLTQKSGAKLLMNQAPGELGALGHQVLERGGLRLGLIGMSLPQTAASAQVSAYLPQLNKELSAARAEGAKYFVLLLAAPRGLALRLVEQVPALNVVVLARELESGDKNDEATAPELLGSTLVVQSPNHLQGIVVVDFYLRGDGLELKDGTGLASAEKRTELQAQVSSLSSRLSRWSRPDSGVRPEELAKRRDELKALQRELAELKTPSPPQQGSYFLYDLAEVRESWGKSPEIQTRLSAYYQASNEANRVAWAEHLPAAAAPGEASYLGVEVCASCHQQEKQFWDKTRHAHAYSTLSQAHKEYNLDCVSCHVTGYEKPGGSTVAHVGQLENVQCEVCHGPGSLHVAGGGDKAQIKRSPSPNLCAESCHHAPHVGDSWSYAEAYPKIVGPGHGR